MPAFCMPPAQEPAALIAAWQAPAHAMPVAGAPTQSKQQVPVQSPEGIKINAPTVDFKVDAAGNRTFEYSDGVEAIYEPTVIRADHLILHEEVSGRRWGEAFGNVRLDDPEGNMTATRMVFDWTNRTGSAENVQLEMGGMSIKARHIDIVPDKWDLTDVEATSCGRERVPFYKVRTPHLTLRPGRQAIAQRPRLSILGHQLVTLPTQRVSLDRRNPGLRMPSVGYKAGQGIGVSWFSGFLLDDQTSLTGSFGFFPKSYPGFNVQLAHTFLPIEKSTAAIPPRSELTERFSWSYMDDIHVTQPLSEENFLRASRNSVALTSVWNTGSTARDVDQRYSKALELSYEYGSKFGSFGSLSQARVHLIREGGGPFHARSVVQSALSVPNVKLLKNLYTRIRFDGSAFLGATAFGWGRAQVGLQYQSGTLFTAGVAYIASASGGDPLFRIDELFSKNAVHARADLNLGPTKISYLAKYDTDRKLLYDREYQIRQVVGCIEPFVVYRKFPSEYAFGFRLRADDFFSAIERRKVRRTKPVGPTVISGHRHTP
jgi:hypothetical protein